MSAAGDDDGPFDAEQLSTALAAAEVGVWCWDAATDRMVWSAETAEMFGLPKDHFVGTLQDFLARIHPDDQAATAEKVEERLAGSAADVSLRHRVQRDGPERWVQSRGRIERDASGAPLRVVGVVRDVTREQRDAAEAEQRERRYRLFTELASDYVYEVDMRRPSLVPQIVAGSFERTTGYTPAEVEGLGGWTEVMHADDRENVPEVVAALQAGRPFVNEYRIVTKDGEVRWLRDRALPELDPASGQLIRIMGGVRDVTERKQLEEELGHAQRLEALARLAGSVAHDFNNLLTIMMGESELLAMEVGVDPGGAGMAPLREAFERATELTSSLLTFARRKPAQRANVRLADVLTHARPMLARAVRERISVSVENHAGDALVSIDRTQLDTALLNLALNARAAMPDGGELLLEGRRVSIDRGDPEGPAGLPPGEYCTIDVQDTGTGMSPEVLRRAFEPFFTTKEGTGTGLGLATVYGMIRQLDGTVSARSTPGAGSTFTIYLPQARGEVGTVQRDEARHAIGGHERLVLVEDEAAVLRTVARTLSELGYEVLAFPSAEDALDDPEALLRADLLITDVRLPGASGISLAQQWVDARPELPILLMSGYVEDPAHAAVIEARRFPFVHKPVTADGLARRVRELLDAASAG